MEDKLISSQWLINDLLNKSFYPAIVKSSIESAPAVDAVEAVRCRECVGRPFWEEDHNGVPVCLLSGLYVRSEDDFCSYGERKDGDENGLH